LHARTLRHQHGDDVLVLAREDDARRPEYAVRFEQRDGLAIAWINNTFRLVADFADSYRNEAVSRVASDLIGQFAPDAAHVHHLTCLSTGIVPMLAATGVPTFYTLHDYWLMCHRGQLFDVHHRACNGPGASGCGACLGPASGVVGFAARGAALARRTLPWLPDAAARGARLVGSGVADLISKPSEVVHQEQARLGHMREICALVSTFLAPSRDIARRFGEFGVPRGRIVQAPYGFDHGLFTRAVRPRPAALRLGFLGSLMVSKAPHVLLEAFELLPRGSATVRLFGRHVDYHGDRRYRGVLDAWRSFPGVSFEEPLPHARIAEALDAIDVLVVPSVWPETSPLVIQEAFLAGVPVVASRIGGIPELVEEGRGGLLFEAGDARDLARQLTRLAEEPGLVDRLRTTIPPVRTIADDVSFTRELYERERRRRGTSSRHATSAPPGGASESSSRIAAVVLNYGTPDDSYLAVLSLLRSRPRLQDLIVVDNGPDDGCEKSLGRVLDRVHYVGTGRNLGYPGGMNVGIRLALARGAHAVLLLNSDVVVPPECVGQLHAALTSGPTVGVAGPLVLVRSDPGTIASAGMSFDVRTGRMRHRLFGVQLSGTDVPPSAIVDGVSGCCVLIRREVFEAVGLLDEDYFFSFEDLEFCLRAHRAGYNSVVAGTARAYHEGGRAIGAASPRRLYFAARNHLRLAATAPGPRRPLAGAARTAFVVALNLAHAALSPGGTLPARVRAVARGTHDYFSGRFGDGG
jgi:GT2 family glycosyltransferase/glycosyltransferase involved in cell wall biosynthesis